MIHYHKYNIKVTDSFNENDFPKVQVEMDQMTTAAKGISAHSKENIIISYLKDHSLKQEWLDENPELTGLLKSGYFITSNIESLFESSRQNKDFQTGFEDFIRRNLAEIVF